VLPQAAPIAQLHGMRLVGTVMGQLVRERRPTESPVVQASEKQDLRDLVVRAVLDELGQNDYV